MADRMYPSLFDADDAMTGRIDRSPWEIVNGKLHVRAGRIEHTRVGVQDESER